MTLDLNPFCTGVFKTLEHLSFISDLFPLVECKLLEKITFVSLTSVSLQRGL